ncbi:hypothetical protein D3C81_1370870 [compost metagenome]
MALHHRACLAGVLHQRYLGGGGGGLVLGAGADEDRLGQFQGRVGHLRQPWLELVALVVFLGVGRGQACADHVADQG